MVGERGSPGCDVMATLPRVATQQRLLSFVLTHRCGKQMQAEAGVHF